MGNVEGIGIDLVSVRELAELDGRTRGAFFEKTFGQAEKQEALRAPDIYGYLAGRFAVKEAVYKAICGRHEEIRFDFRIVQTVRRQNGAPEVLVTEELQSVMNRAHIGEILISITNQGDTALAIALVLSV